MSLDQKYIDQATSQLTPNHNSAVDSLKNQLAQNQQALEQQKGGINSNYDGMAGQQNLNNKMNKNNVSNAMLGRGLGNSSIAVSGLAEQDAKNTRMLSDIEKGRTTDLNNIDQNKALLEQNANNTIGQMDRDLNDKILALAYRLEDRQWDKDFKDKDFALKEQGMQWEQDFKNQQLQLQKEAQAYEQQYKDAMLKLEQEKAKFDMGYKNDYLAMQKEAQQAEIAYKNSMLELQYNQQAMDDAYRQQQLGFQQQQHADNQAWKQKEYDAKAENDKLMQEYINSFLNGGKSSSAGSVLESGSFTNRRDEFTNALGQSSGFFYPDNYSPSRTASSNKNDVLNKTLLSSFK